MTIDELRAELRAADLELTEASRACVVPDPNPLRGCPIDRAHLVERVDAAVVARDAAEDALFAALEAVPA
jgi:hypothetical protein